MIAAEPQPHGAVASRAHVDASRVAAAVRDRRLTTVVTTPVAVVASHDDYNRTANEPTANTLSKNVSKAQIDGLQCIWRHTAM